MEEGPGATGRGRLFPGLVFCTDVEVLAFNVAALESGKVRVESREKLFVIEKDSVFFGSILPLLKELVMVGRIIRL